MSSRSASSSAHQESLTDFFRPLNLDLTRQQLDRDGNGEKKKKEIPTRNRSVLFADEKAEAKLMLETILLFEPDSSFNDPSVVEAVMEDFHDSCNSFDSWEYAHGGNCPNDHGNAKRGNAAQVNWMEIEKQVREQQASEFFQQQSNSSTKEEAVPLIINSSETKDDSSKPPSPKNSGRNSDSRKPRMPNPNLRRALEKSPSLRSLEEAKEARRQREGEIRAQKLLAGKKKAREALPQDGGKGTVVQQKARTKKTNSLPMVPTTPNRNMATTKSPNKTVVTEQLQSGNASNSDNKVKVDNRDRSTGMQRFHLVTEKEPKIEKSKPPLRRVRTHEPVTRDKSTSSIGRPLQPDNQEVRSRPPSTPNAKSKLSMEQSSAQTKASVRDRQVESAKIHTSAHKKAPNGDQTGLSAPQRRYLEVAAAKEASLVGGNQFTKRERSVVKLQAAVRAWRVRTVVGRVLERIQELEDRLQAIERAQQNELDSIRNGPERMALRGEYRGLVGGDGEREIEKERKMINEDLQSIKDDNQGIQKGMQQLDAQNRKVARTTRAKEGQCTQAEARNAALHREQDQIRDKVDQARAKCRQVQSEIDDVIRRTETERRVGRICQATILDVREHAKKVAATSDDAFLKKVHKRSQILDRLNKNPSSDPHQRAMGACPVVLSR